MLQGRLPYFISCILERFCPLYLLLVCFNGDEYNDQPTRALRGHGTAEYNDQSTHMYIKRRWDNEI